MGSCLSYQNAPRELRPVYYFRVRVSKASVIARYMPLLIHPANVSNRVLYNIQAPCRLRGLQIMSISTQNFQESSYQQVLWDLRASFVRPENPQVTQHLWAVLAQNSLPDCGLPNKNQPQEHSASAGDSSLGNSLFLSVSLHHCHTVVVPASLQSTLVNTCNRFLPHGWRDKVGHGSSCVLRWR